MGLVGWIVTLVGLASLVSAPGSDSFRDFAASHRLKVCAAAAVTTSLIRALISRLAI